MPMTPRQKEILSKYRHQLKTVFADGVTKMSEPGHARTWFVPYLRAVLATYIDSRTRTVAEHVKPFGYLFSVDKPECISL